MINDDPAVKQGAKDILNHLFDKIVVRVVKLDKSTSHIQPDKLSTTEIKNMLSF